MPGSESGAVDVVVVTWNSARYIEACLESVLNQTVAPAEVVVVDNASTDTTPDIVAKRFPTVRLLRLQRNVGFAAANNIGFAETGGEWVLTLNPDARLAPDYVETLLAFAGDKPHAGMLGGLLLREDGSDKVIDTTGIEIFTSRRVRDRTAGQPLTERWSKPGRVFGICAAAALYRRRMLKDAAVDGEVFPESFFAYYEDADLAWRAWRRDWDAWFVPDAVGWHKRGGHQTTSRISRFLTHRNRVWLIVRNEPFHRSLLAFPSFYLHQLMMLGRTLRHPYLFRAVVHTLRGLPTAARARRQLVEKRHIPPPFRHGVGYCKD